MTRFVATRCIVAAVFLLVGASCSPVASDTAPDSGVDNKTLTVAFQQEPPDLHLDKPTNGLLVTSWIRESLLESLFGVSSTLEFTTELLASEPEISTHEDGSVSIEYELRQGLRWSDGQPLTSTDVAYTHERWVEGCDVEADGSIVDGGGPDAGCVFEASGRDGLQLVSNFEIVSETQFSIDMVSYYGGWKEMWGPIFAAHAYGDSSAQLNQNLLEMTGPDGILPASGPMVFDSWSRGSTMSLKRNDRYHGSRSRDARNQGLAEIAGVEIVFTSDLDSQINGVLAGEIDVIMAAPDESLGRLADSSSFVVGAEPGPKFEHWAFNLLNPHLAKPEVREAIAFGVDKAEVIQVLYEPLFGDRLDPAGLGNSLWMPNQPNYEDHQAKYSNADIPAAEARLLEAGYDKGDDGVYSHPVVGRLSLRVTTPPGNRLRELQIELLKDQLSKVGIEITIDPGPENFFPETIASEQALRAAATQGEEGDPTVWDIAQFSWTSGPWPGVMAGSFRSGAGSNVYGFANDEYDELLLKCGSEIEVQAQAACYNELDQFVTTLDRGQDGLFVLPLTQQPSYFGYNRDAVAEAPLVGDVRSGGPLANVADYRMKP